jgi:hypothetical protein
MTDQDIVFLLRENEEQLAQLTSMEERLRLAYRERAMMVAKQTEKHYSHWTIDPESPTWKVICIHLNTPEGSFTTVTWHISADDLNLFPDDLSTYTVSDYDGHDTEEKWRRFRKYA